jgi:hypothetical protein
VDLGEYLMRINEIIREGEGDPEGVPKESIEG